MTSLALFERRGLNSLVLMLFLCLIVAAPDVFGRPATAPVSVDFDGDALLNETGDGSVRVVAVLRSADSIETQLTVYVTPARGEAVAEGLVINDTLTVSGSRFTDVDISIIGPGDFEIRAIAQPTGGGPGEAAVMYVRIDKQGDPTSYSHIDYLAETADEASESGAGFGTLSVPPDIADDDQPPLTQDDLVLREPKVRVSGGEITVTSTSIEPLRKTKYTRLTGKITTKINGVDVPMRRVEITIWDHDPISPDDKLGTTRTDANGNYDITVVNDDGPFGGGIDVYIYIYSKEHNIAELVLVPDGEGGYVPFYYAWRSPTHDDIKDKEKVINYSITKDSLAAGVWSGSAGTRWLVQSTTGHDLSYVEVRFPGFVSGTFYRNGIINIDSKFGDAPETVGHEFGHAVQDQAYGGMPDGSGGPHSFCDNAKPGLAWSEGFGTWLGLAASDQSGYMHWHVGDSGMDIERWCCGPPDANHDEGRVAAVLWDFYDVPKDNSGRHPNCGRDSYGDNNERDELVDTSQILLALWTRKQNTVQQYWPDLKKKLNNPQDAPSEEIAKFNFLEDVNF